MARYSERHSLDTRRPRLILLWLALIAIVLYGLDTQGALDPVTDRTAPLLAPVTRALTATRQGIGSWLGGIFGTSDLAQENERLKAQITELKNENLALRSAEVENMQLRRTAGMRERYGWQTITANVVGRTPDSATRQIVIDRGSDDGLQPGMPVVSHVDGSPDALIGLVDTVTNKTATVLLITDVRSVISGYILHRDPQSGTLLQPNGEIEGQWQLGSRLRMRQIDRQAKFAVDDDVLTAGISRQLGFEAPAARIPPNIPIGKVTSLQPDGNSLMAEINPYFDPEQVQLVWIIVGVD